MKISGKHSSLIDLSQELIQYLDRFLPELKISPGIIISKRSATARNHKIKLNSRNFGFEASVTQNATIQKLRIYSKQQLLIQSLVQDFCNDNNVQFISQK